MKTKRENVSSDGCNWFFGLVLTALPVALSVLIFLPLDPTILYGHPSLHPLNLLPNLSGSFFSLPDDTSFFSPLLSSLSSSSSSSSSSFSSAANHEQEEDLVPIGLPGTTNRADADCVEEAFNITPDGITQKAILNKHTFQCTKGRSRVLVNSANKGEFVLIQVTQTPPLDPSDDVICYFFDQGAKPNVQGSVTSEFTSHVLYFLSATRKSPGYYCWVDIFEGRLPPTSVINCTQKSVWLHGWLFTSSSSSSSSMSSCNHVGQRGIMLTSSGLGAQKDNSLGWIVSSISSKYDVFYFDCQTWGGSGGFPRNLANPSLIVEDWNSAATILHRTLVFGTHVKSPLLVLWGSSYGGGHVVRSYHELRRRRRRTSVNIVGVVSVTAFMDGPVTVSSARKTRGILPTLRIASIGVADYIRAKLFQFLNSQPEVTTTNNSGFFTTSLLLAPLYIPIAARPPRLSMMSFSPDNFKKWASKIPSKGSGKRQEGTEQEVGGGHNGCMLGGWRNAIAARSLPYMRFYSPIAQVCSLVDVPVLFLLAKSDKVVINPLVYQAIHTLKAAHHTSEGRCTPPSSIANAGSTASSSSSSSSPVHLPIPEAPKGRGWVAFREVPGDHFDIYNAPEGLPIVEETISFLNKVFCG